MKSDPNCPYCEIDRKAGFDNKCIHRAIAYTQEINGKHHAVVDLCDGKPAFRTRKGFDDKQDAYKFAQEQADIMTEQAWAMGHADHLRISKGGKT